MRACARRPADSTDRVHEGHHLHSGAQRSRYAAQGVQKVGLEVELGRVIGTQARYVAQKEALSFVAGYCAVNNGGMKSPVFLKKGDVMTSGKPLATLENSL